MYNINEFLQQAVADRLIEEQQLTEQIKAEMFVGSALYTLFPNQVASFDAEFVETAQEVFNAITSISNGELIFSHIEEKQLEQDYQITFNINGDTQKITGDHIITAYCMIPQRVKQYLSETASEKQLFIDNYTDEETTFLYLPKALVELADKHQ